MSQVNKEKNITTGKPEKEHSESNCSKMNIHIINFYDIFDV
jgi:hypothetical protein